MRILIVEDEAVIALDLEALVKAMGHEVCGIASRASEAIRLARERSPDLVLMDMHLAQGDSGLAAAQVIAADFGMPVIIVSGNVSEIVPGALSFRPVDLIQKPYSEPELQRAITAVAR